MDNTGVVSDKCTSIDRVLPTEPAMGNGVHEMISIIPVAGLGEIEVDADLAHMIHIALIEGGEAFQPGDVLVVTQKVVSKSEGRRVNLSTVTPSPRARELSAITCKDARLVELVLQESTEVLRAVPDVLIVRHRSGHVMANAGIDRSNIGAGHSDDALLLPLDADASAADIARRLAPYWPARRAVVISDSFGRPWREGVVNVALGSCGFPSLFDRRGQHDRDGRALEVTQVALGDLVASAAGLAMGEGDEAVPAALIRGFNWTAPAASARALVRDPKMDLFR
jgi:coenzyme F420-0:L-glutamate ligase/coenzyme F420-1:gamma-L-glutamate ligase